jgi:hypothetical protein
MALALVATASCSQYYRAPLAPEPPSTARSTAVVWDARIVEDAGDPAPTIPASAPNELLGSTAPLASGVLVTSTRTAMAALPPAPAPPKPKPKPTPPPPPEPGPYDEDLPPVPAGPDVWGPPDTVQPAPAPKPAPTPRRPAPAPTPPVESEESWLPSTPVATAGAIGVGGLVFGAMGLGVGDDAPNVGLTTVGLGVALVGFTTAGFLLLWEMDDEDTATRGKQVAPPSPGKNVRVGVGAGSVAVTGAF